MPELMIDFITSLEGYGAAEGWPGWWGLEGPEYLAWLGDQPEADYTVLMGANTYRLMSGTGRRGRAGHGRPGGHVEDRLLEHVERAALVAEHTSWCRQDAVEAVREMKENGGESMRTIGSLTLCRSLLEAGLVDRFRVVVFPVITGSTGKDRIYDGYPDVSLEMVEQPHLRRAATAARVRPLGSGRATRRQEQRCLREVDRSNRTTTNPARRERRP